MGEDLCDVAHGLRAALTENHPCSGSQVFGILDEAEEARGLVSRAEVLLVHGDDGGCLL